MNFETEKLYKIYPNLKVSCPGYGTIFLVTHKLVKKLDDDLYESGEAFYYKQPTQEIIAMCIGRFSIADCAEKKVSVFQYKEHQICFGFRVTAGWYSASLEKYKSKFFIELTDEF